MLGGKFLLFQIIKIKIYLTSSQKLNDESSRDKNTLLIIQEMINRN